MPAFFRQCPVYCRYSFDHGPIHFLHFSTEHDFAPGSEQFAWILRDLQTVDRSITPWVVAGFHRPFYTDSVYGNSDSGDVGFTDAIRAALERLFFQFQVCATLCPSGSSISNGPQVAPQEVL